MSATIWCKKPEMCNAGPNEHMISSACAELQPFRAKWMLDGAKTLPEAAQKARDFADWLQGLHNQGYVLDGEVTDDYGTAYKPKRD